MRCVPRGPCDLHPRGRSGARQVETRGLIAAAFTHRDSRAGRSGPAHPRRGREQGPDRAGNGSRSTARSCTSTSSPPRRPTTPPSSATLTDSSASRSSSGPPSGRQAAGPGDRRRRRGPVRAVVAPPGRHRRPARELAARLQRGHGRPPTTGESIALAQRRTWRPARPSTSHAPWPSSGAPGVAEAVDVLGRRGLSSDGRHRAYPDPRPAHRSPPRGSARPPTA